MKSFSRYTLALLIGLCSVVAHADSLLDQARGLIIQDKASAAYSLLEPLEGDRAGDVPFDLVFAQAAIDVGQHTRAVFALERVLAQQPGNTVARAEIARAYMGLGELQSAKREFNNVKSREGIPAPVLKSIDSYLSAVERLEAATLMSIRGYVEGSFGYDTNVNVAPNSREVAIPGFGGLPFVLDEKSRANAAWFASAGAGAFLRAPISKDAALVASLSGAHRANAGAGQFDMLNADASVGAILSRQKNTYSVNLQATTMAIQSDRFRDSLGFSAQWQHNLDGRNQVSAFAQYADVTLPGQNVRDHDRWVLGGGYAHATRAGTVGYGSVYLVQEATRKDFDYLDLDGYGIRLGGVSPLTDNLSAFAHVTAERRNHKAVDPAFLVKRTDDQFGAGVGLGYQLSSKLKLSAQYSWVENRSNVDINTYKRETFTVSARQDF